MGCVIHPTAIIEAGAELGEGVSVGPYTIIASTVRIGDRTSVASHVVIQGHTRIGSDNTIFQFASLGSAPQDLKFRGEASTLEIGDKNVIREYVTMNPGTATGHMRTVVGNENLFMMSAHVAHDCEVGDRNVFANSVALAGHVQVGNRTILGGLSAIHQFARIGDFVMLSGGTMVGEDVPPYCFGDGDRCKLRGINVIGLQRGGFTESEIADVKKAYRHFFATRGSVEKKLESFPKHLAEQPRVKFMLDFVSTSKRGICTPHKQLSVA